MQGNGGDALVQGLLDHGVDTVFGLPGVQTYPVFDALAKHSDAIRTVSARHEQATAYMALGYAEATGRPGVYSVVPGPGVLNTMGALCTAWALNSPVLCVTGQVPSAFLGKGRGHLHEIPDQQGAVRQFCKYVARVERVEDAPRIVAEAFRAMTSGRPGPALIEMCWDDLAKQGSYEPFAPLARQAPPSPDAGAIAEAAALARKAKRPMIMVGSGARHAAAEILALAEALGAPVASHRGGRGIAPSGHPLHVSNPAARRLWDETDLLLAFGTRLEMPYMRWKGMRPYIAAPEAPPHLVRVDIDPAEMERLKPNVGLVADSAEAAKAILSAIEADGALPPKDRAPIERARAEAHQALAALTPHVSHLEAIRRALPRDGVFVDELTQAGYAAFSAWEAYAPRTYLSSGSQGNLGYGFMTALGAKVGRGDAPVVSITGDGGFLYGASELATAVKEKIGLVVILFDNGAYGNVKRDQMRLFDGRVNASELGNPDFAKLAEAYGARYARVEGAAALEAAVADGFGRDVPTLVHVPVNLADEKDPWPFVFGT